MFNEMLHAHTFNQLHFFVCLIYIYIQKKLWKPSQTIFNQIQIKKDFNN